MTVFVHRGSSETGWSARDRCVRARDPNTIHGNSTLDRANPKRHIIGPPLHNLATLLPLRQARLLIVGNGGVLAKSVAVVEEFDATQDDGYHLGASAEEKEGGSGLNGWESIR